VSPTPSRASTTPHRLLSRITSRGLRRACTTGLVSGLALSAAATAGATAGAAEARAAKAASLAGVSITFGDQLKEYQSIFAATDALKGARYTVNWANFVGGPPVIAAETGGSVDVGDMAETPTIFAQSAGDPVKVVAATEGINPKTSPYDIVVPSGSPIKTLAQLKGHTVAVQEGTVEQYFLVQALAKGNVPYSAVKLDNLAVTTASTAVTNGQVDAAVISQPLTGLDTATGKVRILATGAGLLQTYGYLTASKAALANPQKAAALTDFIGRFYKAIAELAKEPGVAAATYAKTYGVPLAVAQQAAAAAQSKGVPISPSIVSYQQNEANTFQKLGLISSHLNVKAVFDLPFNKVVSTAAGLQS
jgi:sulfonate transport system substrate-binding protein